MSCQREQPLATLLAGRDLQTQQIKLRDPPQAGRDLATR